MNLFRTLFLAISFFSVTGLSAQLEKGRIQFGADLVTHLAIGDGFPFKYRALMPEVSYFLFDNLSLGISGLYTQSKSGSSYGTIFYPVEGREYNFGLITRYYFLQRGSFSLFAEHYLGGGERMAHSDYFDHLNFRFSEFKTGLGMGMIYHIIPNAALSLSIRNNRIFRINDDSVTRRSEGDLRLGLKINLNSSK